MGANALELQTAPPVSCPSDAAVSHSSTQRSSLAPLRLRTPRCSLQPPPPHLRALQLLVVLGRVGRRRADADLLHALAQRRQPTQQVLAQVLLVACLLQGVGPVCGAGACAVLLLQRVGCVAAWRGMSAGSWVAAAQRGWQAVWQHGRQGSGSMNQSKCCRNHAAKQQDAHKPAQLCGSSQHTPLSGAAACSAHQLSTQSQCGGRAPHLEELVIEQLGGGGPLLRLLLQAARHQVAHVLCAAGRARQGTAGRCKPAGTGTAGAGREAADCCHAATGAAPCVQPRRRHCRAARPRRCCRPCCLCVVLPVPVLLARVPRTPC